MGVLLARPKKGRTYNKTISSHVNTPQETCPSKMVESNCCLCLKHPDLYQNIVKHIGLTIARSQASWAIFFHQSNQLLAAG